MTTAEEYLRLADEAYSVDPLRHHPPHTKGKRFCVRVDPAGTLQRYEVLDSENHEANGFQAMAVAPVVNGVVDTSHVVVVYAGTNPDHRADILEDVSTVIGGKNGPGSQVLDAHFFADRVRARYPQATMSTVGHSLGGFLALLVAAENDWDSTTFNAPDPWDSLTGRTKDRLKAATKAGRNRLHNYVNVWDVVGNILGNRTGAADYVADEPGRDAPSYHDIGKDKAFSFNPDGSIAGAGAKGRRLEDVIGNAVDTIAPGASITLSPGISVLAGIARSPAAMASLAKYASGAMIAVNSAAALGLASSIAGTASALIQVKEANGRILPRMEAGLLAAKNAVAGLPYITAYDIDLCVDVNRLHVRQNVDEQAVHRVARLVDEHLVLVGQLSDGITRSVTHTLEHDARWAMSFGLQK
ncbi:hypothetical protein [Leifsonia sp. NPDC077715]|uniref:hypothetical protein n=1 Tax=Leifsonia sp. NPDC077715 TaxID=3155539 RepID=UPI003420DF6F